MFLAPFFSRLFIKVFKSSILKNTKTISVLEL